MATLEFATDAGVTVIYDRLVDAKVQIIHGPANAAGEVRLVPIMQFAVRIPFDLGNGMARWALAPAAKGRFAKATLTLIDRAVDETHKWELEKAFVYSMEEIEFPADSHNATSQENIMQVIIRGLLANGEDYDGKNVMVMTSAKGGSTALAAQTEDAAPAASTLQTASAPDDNKKKTWIEIALHDKQGNPVPNARYRLKLADGSVQEGTLDGDGHARVDGIEEGTAQVSFPDMGIDWKPA